MKLSDYTNRPIVVRLPNWVGDVCMSMPSLQLLSDSGHPLIVCARPWAESLVTALKPMQFVPITGHSRQDLKALRQIAPARRASALGLVLPDSFSSAALFRLAGIQAAGYRDDARSLLLKWPIKKTSHGEHAVWKWWRLTHSAMHRWGLIKFGQSLPPPPFSELELSRHHRTCAENSISQVLPQETPFVLIAPTATGTHRGQIKVWPHFAELTDRLIADGYKVLACPPRHELEQVARAAPNATVLKPLDLPSFCALCKAATLVICNDSGVSHLCALVRARQLTLFGVTDPSLTGPWSPIAHCAGQNGQWPALETVYTRVCKYLSHAQYPAASRQTRWS
jgi:heptosyltransferase II